MNEAKITPAEMVEMFGETMPMEAVDLLWNSDGDMTIGEMRAKLRAMAARPKPVADREGLVGRLNKTVGEAEEMGVRGRCLDLMRDAAARIPALEEALTDCVRRLRRCAANGGNSPEAVDALCGQFEAAISNPIEKKL